MRSSHRNRAHTKNPAAENSRSHNYTSRAGRITRDTPDTEYNVGNYYREFALNETIDESKIRATLRNGVLELELPKKEQAKPRRIEVSSK